jgi:cobalt-zinc-cadmium resistance protein CzcA
MISFFNQLRAEGLSVHEAVLRGSALRLRAVVMTSLTAILGLMPAAMATAIGTQAQKPLAIVVVGGLSVNLLLTQYLVPVLYSYFPNAAPVPDELTTEAPESPSQPDEDATA